MPTKFSKSQMAKLEKRTAKMYLEGYTQYQISDKLKISQPTVSRILASLRDEWKESSLIDLSERKLIELAKLDTLEIEYWLAWRRSQKNAVMVTKKELGFDTVDGSLVSKAETATQTKGQVGDARFLDGAAKCIDRRCKILGLDAPKKVAEFNANNKMSWNEFIGIEGDDNDEPKKGNE